MDEEKIKEIELALNKKYKFEITLNRDNNELLFKDVIIISAKKNMFEKYKDEIFNDIKYFFSKMGLENIHISECVNQEMIQNFLKTIPIKSEDIKVSFMVTYQ